MTYDVVIYRLSDGEVVSIAGKDLKYEGHRSAESRLITVMDRLGDDYNAAIVDHNSITIGDKLTEDLTR